MARLARAEVFAADEVAIIHAIGRTVRRCYLLGADPLTAKNYDHRKTWMEEELQRLARFFGCDLLCYAVLSNHFHLILRSRPDVVATWDDAEVARRWLMLRDGRWGHTRNAQTHFATSTCIAGRLPSGPNGRFAISTPEEFEFFFSAVT